MNYQERAIVYQRRALFASCGVGATISRGGVAIVSTVVVVAKITYEDADWSTNKTFANFVDLLVGGDVGYEPRSGDVVDVGGESFIVRPRANELWKWDDPYRIVKRFHAQRQTRETSGVGN